MSTCASLRPREQLCPVDDELPAPSATAAPHLHTRAPCLPEVDGLVPAEGAARVGFVPLMFSRVEARGEGGVPFARWRFEGPILVEAAEVARGGFAGRAHEWVRVALGPRCVAVAITDLTPEGDAVAVIDFE